jgi:Flp pilus assembly pilin Flp
MLRCVKKFISDEAGAVTIEWVVLTAGVIALGIAGYSAFKIGMDSSEIIVAHHSERGILPSVNGGNAITRLVKTVELELKMFRACNFSSVGAQFESGSNAAACAFRENGPIGSPDPGPPAVAPNPTP